MTPPHRLRALLSTPDFIVMPAIWDGLTAKLAAAAGFILWHHPGFAVYDVLWHCVELTSLGGLPVALPENYRHLGCLDRLILWTLNE